MGARSILSDSYEMIMDEISRCEALDYCEDLENRKENSEDEDDNDEAQDDKAEDDEDDFDLPEE